MATTASADVTGRTAAGAEPTTVPATLGWAVIAVGIVLGWGWVLLAQRVGATITIESEVLANALFYLILFVPLAVVALAAGALTRVRVFRRGEQAGRWATIGFCLGLAGLLATLALSWLQGGLVTGSVSPAAFGVIVLGIVLTLFQTGIEEVFFRGWLQPAMIERIGPLAGIVVTALCFAAFHVAGGARAPLSLVSIVLAGVLFGLLAWRSGGIVAAVAAHFAWNVIESSVLGLVPNPANDVFGSLLDLDLMGAPLWGGQEEGLNASIGTIAVLLALIVPLAWRPMAIPAKAPATA
jgi:membrane protease YdiL (CAAX protease family)